MRFAHGEAAVMFEHVTFIGVQAIWAHSIQTPFELAVLDTLKIEGNS